MSGDADHWQRMIDGLRAGDESVAREFWERYGGPLASPALHRLDVPLFSDEPGTAC